MERGRDSERERREREQRTESASHRSHPLGDVFRHTLSLYHVPLGTLIFFSFKNVLSDLLSVLSLLLSLTPSLTLVEICSKTVVIAFFGVSLMP